MSKLPQRTYCSSCGATLYYGSEPEGALDTILRHGGKCPNCAKQLNFNPETIKITAFPELGGQLTQGAVQLDAAKQLLGRILESGPEKQTEAA